MPVISRQMNNQDVFVWALFLLGGSERPIDVEEIYLKCFELAPARLGWRTRPEIPDYKKIAKALQSVEAKTHIGLIEKLDQYHRRLTLSGTQWISENRTVLESRYGSSPVAASMKSPHERLRRRITDSPILHKDEISLIEVAELLECSPASSSSVWQSRVTQMEVAAVTLGDEGLKAFLGRVRKLLEESGFSK